MEIRTDSYHPGWVGRRTQKKVRTGPQQRQDRTTPGRGVPHQPTLPGPGRTEAACL